MLYLNYISKSILLKNTIQQIICDAAHEMELLAWWYRGHIRE